MKYKKGYKYQLVEAYQVDTKIMIGPPKHRAFTEYISLLWDGLIIARKGYAWNGPSGPVRDTPRTMRASLVHDALYQLIREGHIPPNYRDRADRLFQSMCIEDGVPRWRAAIYYRALRAFGHPAADPANKRKVITVVGGRRV